jgi:hypothetical protein
MRPGLLTDRYLLMSAPCVQIGSVPVVLQNTKIEADLVMSCIRSLSAVASALRLAFPYYAFICLPLRLDPFLRHIRAGQDVASLRQRYFFFINPLASHLYYELHP